jgi:hypothetical protein
MANQTRFVDDNLLCAFLERPEAAPPASPRNP